MVTCFKGSEKDKKKYLLLATVNKHLIAMVLCCSQLIKPHLLEECIHFLRFIKLLEYVAYIPAFVLYTAQLVKDKKKEEPSNSDTSTDVPGKKRIAYKAAEQVEEFTSTLCFFVFKTEVGLVEVNFLRFLL